MSFDKRAKNNNFVSKFNLEYKEQIECNHGEILFEGMTSIAAIINGIASGINQRRLLRIYLSADRIPKKEKEVQYLISKSKELGFLVYITNQEALDGAVTGNTHGGIVAICTDRPLPLLNDAMHDLSLPFCSDNGFFVLLEGIEDPYNFGFTLRSLYAAGADGVLLSPRNWMEVAGIVARSSAGASEQLPMAIADPREALMVFRQRSYKIICAGIRDSVSMYDADLKFPVLLVVGGEKRGISASILSLADRIVRIDYGRSFRGSLSAASAATVLAFEIAHQNK